MTPKKIRLLLFSSVVLAALTLGAFAWERAQGRKAHDSIVALLASAKDGAEIDIAQATGFAWDRLHVFAPYTPASVIEGELGFAWPGAAKSGISGTDSICLLVFVANKQVVEQVKLARRFGDFAPAAGTYARDRARFRVTRRDGVFQVAPLAAE